MNTKLEVQVEKAGGTAQAPYPASAATPRSGFGVPLWIFAIGTLLFASAAIMLVVWNPRALALALGAGVLALATRAVFGRVKTVTHDRAAGSSAVANAGLVIAGMAVAPLLAFALLWLTLLLLIGATWLLHVIRLI